MEVGNVKFLAFHREYMRQIRKLSHPKLKILSKEMAATIKERFISGRPPKTEMVERGFSESEFIQFMDVVDDEEDWRCFMLMATLGLRVGELAMLRGRDLEGDQLRITTLKGGYASVIRLPPQTLALLPQVAQDELMFKRSTKMLRDRFARYRAKSGLTGIYIYTQPCGHGRQTRNPRYRLSLHSLRHFAIQRVYSETKDADLARRFARHRHMETTEQYLKSTRKEELEMALGAIMAKGIKTFDEVMV